MGLFQWIGKLLDDLVEWLGDIVIGFLEGVVSILQRVWDTVIATALVAAFGTASVLYAVFYAGQVLGETILEIWDPVFYDIKPAQVFVIKQAPTSSPLPTNRNDAKIIVLENVI